MKRFNVWLKLVLPRALEEQMVDHLLQHPEWAGPFVAQYVDGHGAPERIASNAEQVRGRAERVQIELPMVEEDARALLAHLIHELAGADITWWLTPVLDGGSFNP
ncbi:MAG: DUF3240 domain-containing protein [Rhodocyclaceae bacterium]|nr:DUF3240 domain-containing protein [Rhodocyclaceae bacterium]